MHVALAAPTEQALREYHAAAIKSGGTDHGAPGPRDHVPGGLALKRLLPVFTCSMLDSSTIDSLGHKQLADIALHADRLLPCLSPAVCSEKCAQALSRRCSDKANVSESEMQAGSCSMETLIERLQTSLYAIQDAAEGMCFCTADQALDALSGPTHEP